MAEAPAWLPAHGGITAFVYLAQFFMTSAALPTTGTNVFSIIAQFFTFTLISGVPGWVSFVLFMVLTVPWIFLLFSYLLPLANTTVGLVILALSLTTVFGAALAGFFS